MAVDLLKKGLKLSHIRLLGALTTQTSLSAAAEIIGISQPAASRLASEIDHILGSPLYTRTGRGVVLTEEGHSLAARSARVLLEIDAGGREIAELKTGSSGTVRIGAVTGPAVEYVVPALRSFRLSNPGVSVGVDVGTSDEMMPRLLDGTLDFAIARRPPDLPEAAFVERPLADEPVSFAVRKGHPLERREKLILSDLLDYDWVVPFEGAILRTCIERALRAHKLKLPEKVLSTSSFLVTIVAVAQTNAVAPLATSVAKAFIDSGLVILPVEADVTVETYSFYKRADSDLTPAAKILADLIVSKADSFG